MSDYAELLLIPYPAALDAVLVPGPFDGPAIETSNVAYATTPKVSCTSSTTVIRSGETKSGTLAATDCLSTVRSGRYYDNFTFEAQAGTAYTIDMVSEVDTYLYLLNDAGATLAFDDDAGAGTNSRIVYTPLVSAILTIHACFYSAGDVGAYTITLIGGSTPSTEPFNLSATPFSATQIDLAWVNSGMLCRIERRADAEAEYTQIATVGATAVSFSDTGVSENTRYFYRVVPFYDSSYGYAVFIPSLYAPWVTFATYACAVYAPLIDALAIPSAIEFRHLPLIPWIMPMTSPVYPPGVTATLTNPTPGVSIRGLWSPADVLFGWSYDSGTDTISFPLASLFELTAAQADPATGDWRAILLAMSNTLWDAYIELDTAPQAMVLEYNPGYMMTAGPMVNTVKAEYTATVYLTFPEKFIADEP